MRYLVPLLCLFAMPALAQQTDWKAIGTPLDDSSYSAFKDRYVYFDGNTTDKTIGLDIPVLSQQELAQWIKDNLAQILTLNDHQYNQQINATQTLFTPTGFADYVVYLEKAGMKKFLTTNNFKVAAFVEGTPDIKARGLRPGTSLNAPAIYVWEATAQLVLSYLNYRNEPPPNLFPQKDKRVIVNRFPVEVQMEIVRIPMQKNNNLVAINRIAFTAK